jgi:hypothetical protein
MNRPVTAGFAALLLAPLIACAPKPRGEPPAPKAEAYRGGPLLVGAWGAGPIRDGTPFSLAAIKKLFPTADVRETVLPVAGDTTTRALFVQVDGKDWLEIDDGSTSNDDDQDDETQDRGITQVRVIAGPVQGPHGERLGQPWKGAGFDLSECDAGGERDRDTVFCTRPGEGAVVYQFQAVGWDSEELPPPALIQKSGYLKAIIWAPSGAGDQ